ncbi:MAG: rhomboid family intramembrane serine protease [Actinobacteria bacterium]|nr:rhomboid family intramembrane serine protease [Actinomycetota bacterium]
MAAPEQTETLVCYRHPKAETAVRCSTCSRPICTECMVFAAVGIKCPECAGQPIGVKKATARARGAAGSGAGVVVTKALIGLNVALFVVQLTQSAGGRSGSGPLFEYGALYGPLVADGEWWRLVTNAFLHAGALHLAFNMLMLWWFGGPLEALLGRARFLAVYAVAILTGAAGALLLTPTSATVGASGAVFGILGAGLFLERRGINVFGGAALAVVAFNVVFSFLVPNISIGGHIGGLVGGLVAAFILSGFGRGHAAYQRLRPLEVAGLAALALVALAIAYARVRGLA